jgi:cyclase
LIKRIISRLDIKNNFLVKGLQLEGLRVIGYPETFAKEYYFQNIDEIIFQDVVASLYKRNQSKHIVNNITNDIFVPIVVGGGIRTTDDINDILLHGADRVSINTQAVNNPKFIEKCALKFGSSTIAISVEALKINDEYKIFTDNGRSPSNLNLYDWVKKIQDLGAGEIMITSINNEGTGKGFDLCLMDKVKKICKIPLLAHGGAGKPEHVLELFKKIDVDGCILSSAFHYYYIGSIKDNKVLETGSSSFIHQKKFDDLDCFSIEKLKKYLAVNKINIR